MSAILVFDASSLISLSEKCFFGMLQRIQEHSGARFLISRSVWHETVEVPQRIKRFELNAYRVKQAIETGWLEITEPTAETKQLEQRIDFLSNNSFFIGKNPLHILQAGEIESLALCLAFKANALVIDERTCRMLVEEPSRLQNYIGLKHDKKILKSQSNLNGIQKMFRTLPMVRSCDLIGWAYRHGLFKAELNQTSEALEAALYALKFSGCAVSENEIESFVKKNGSHD